MGNSNSPLRLPESPPSPPPDISPTYTPHMEFLVPEHLGQCLHHYIYVWLQDGDSFWMFPISINEDTLYGYVWAEDHWVYQGFNWRTMSGFF